MKAPQDFQTDRLILTAPAPADAEAIFECFSSDLEVARYLGWPRHLSIADTRAFLDWSAADWLRWPAGPYLIRARDGGRLLGSTGLHFEREDEAVTGYVLAKSAWGKGYATEALHAIVDVACRVGVRRISAFCHPDHRASWRVLEKCGFTRDRDWRQQADFPNLSPGRPQDVFRYELVVREDAERTR